MYALIGIVLALTGGILSLVRRRSARSFYASDVYHMTERSHTRFALASGCFVVGFLAAILWPVIAVPLLAVYVLAIILYASSFARGFSGDEEP